MTFTAKSQNNTSEGADDIVEVKAKTTSKTKLLGQVRLVQDNCSFPSQKTGNIKRTTRILLIEVGEVIEPKVKICLFKKYFV